MSASAIVDFRALRFSCPLGWSFGRGLEFVSGTRTLFRTQCYISLSSKLDSLSQDMGTLIGTNHRSSNGFVRVISVD